MAYNVPGFQSHWQSNLSLSPRTRKLHSIWPLPTLHPYSLSFSSFFITYVPYFLPQNTKPPPPSGSPHLLFILPETLLSHSFAWLVSCHRGLGSKVTSADGRSYRPTPSTAQYSLSNDLIYPPHPSTTAWAQWGQGPWHDFGSGSQHLQWTVPLTRPTLNKQLLNEDRAVHLHHLQASDYAWPHCLWKVSLHQWNASKHPRIEMESRWTERLRAHGLFKPGFTLTTRHHVTHVILTEVLQKNKTNGSCGHLWTNHSPARVDSAPEGLECMYIYEASSLTAAQAGFQARRLPTVRSRTSAGRCRSRRSRGRPSASAPAPPPFARPPPRPRRGSLAPRALPGRSPCPGATPRPSPRRWGSRGERPALPLRRRRGPARGGARRGDGVRPPGNSQCAQSPFRKRKGPLLLASSRPRAGTAPAAVSRSSPLTTGPRRIWKSEFAALPLVRNAAPGLTGPTPTGSRAIELPAEVACLSSGPRPRPPQLSVYGRPGPAPTVLGAWLVSSRESGLGPCGSEVVALDAGLGPWAPNLLPR